MGQTPIYDPLRGERINADVPATGADPQLVGHPDREQAVRWLLPCGKHRHTPPAAPRRCPVPAAIPQRGAPRQVSTMRIGDTEVACDRYTAANLDPQRRQMLSSRGSPSIMTPVTRLRNEDDAAHDCPQRAGPSRSGDGAGLPIRVPFLVVFLPLGSWWIRDRSGRRVQGVEGLGRYTGPRRQVRSA
jgi:hypothetical protein